MSRGPKTDAEKKRVKYADYMRAIGTPLHVNGAEREQLRQHLAKLRDAGMSYAQIAASAPGSRCEMSVARVLESRTDVTHRDVYNDLMQAVYVKPVGQRTGIKIDATGTIRRMRALIADGFGCGVIAKHLDVSLQAVYQLTTGERQRIMSATALRVADVYDLLQFAEPEGFGGSKQGISKARGIGRRNGWATRSCWDSDTIDDPSAFPQWTGECGTWIGARIHRRENIPMCEACQPVDRGLEIPGFSAQKLRDLRASHGLSRATLGEMIGVNASTIQWWEEGRSVPERQWRIDKLLSVLDATFEDVCESEAW